MDIENATYVEIDSYPVLEVMLNGIQTWIPLEQKMLLVESGIIFVGEAVDTEAEFDGKRFRGCTNDPQVFALWQRFVDDCNNLRFEPGPLSDADGSQT